MRHFANSQMHWRMHTDKGKLIIATGWENMQLSNRQCNAAEEAQLAPHEGLKSKYRAMNKNTSKYLSGFSLWISDTQTEVQTLFGFISVSCSSCVAAYRWKLKLCNFKVCRRFQTEPHKNWQSVDEKKKHQSSAVFSSYNAPLSAYYVHCTFQSAEL